MIRITPNISIDESEIRVDFVRSGGPGGQNVNKVATAAQLRFDAAGSTSLPEDVRHRLIALCANRVSRAGTLIIHSDRYRTQRRNRDDAVRRLVELIRRAAVVPKARRKTKPPTASRRRRLEAKRHRSTLKRLRDRVQNDQ
ncbi:MAG: aminoacyl-tRNA hydrolase [Planctomycetes bacterium]|nr:aminoacyl-tRNA hydrolase [Planctomycetota bacterium]